MNVSTPKVNMSYIHLTASSSGL